VTHLEMLSDMRANFCPRCMKCNTALQYGITQAEIDAAVQVNENLRRRGYRVYEGCVVDNRMDPEPMGIMEHPDPLDY